MSIGAPHSVITPPAWIPGPLSTIRDLKIPTVYWGCEALLVITSQAYILFALEYTLQSLEIASLTQSPSIFTPYGYRLNYHITVYNTTQQSIATKINIKIWLFHNVLHHFYHNNNFITSMQYPTSGSNTLVSQPASINLLEQQKYFPWA